MMPPTMTPPSYHFTRINRDKINTSSTTTTRLTSSAIGPALALAPTGAFYLHQTHHQLQARCTCPSLFVDTLKGFLSVQSSPSSSLHGIGRVQSVKTPGQMWTIMIWPSAVRDALSAPLRLPSMDLSSRPLTAARRLTPLSVSYSRSSCPFDRARRNQCSKLKRRDRSSSR